VDIGVSELDGEIAPASLWARLVGLVYLIDFMVWMLIVPIVCVLQFLMSTRPGF